MTDNFYTISVAMLHPGVPHMNARYTLQVTDANQNAVAKDNLIVLCDEESVVLDGLDLVVPYVVRASEKPLAVTVFNKKKPDLRGSLPIHFPKYSETPTFYDDFHTFDEKKWSVDNVDTNRDKDGNKTGCLPGEVRDGNLIFRAEKEGSPCFGLSTEGKFEQAYGCFSARIKMPFRGTADCAFWLCSQKGKVYVPNKFDPNDSRGEIDVVEYYPQWGDDRWQPAVHWNAWSPRYGRSVGSDRVKGRNIGENWHTYSAVWTPERIYWYFDEELSYTYRGSGVGPGSDGMFLRIDMGVRDFDFWGSVYDPGEYPFEMRVDRIRVYSLKEEEE